MAGARQIVSFQLKNDEVERFNNLEAAAMARNKLYTRDALLRELVGLDEFDLVTEKEWLYFRGIGKMPQTLVETLARAQKASRIDSSSSGEGDPLESKNGVKIVVRTKKTA